MQTVHVEVSQQDIDVGVSKTTACPVALALKRATGLPCKVQTRHPAGIYIGDVALPFPDGVLDFVKTFDASKRIWKVADTPDVNPPGPIAFDIAIPEERMAWTSTTPQKGEEG